MESRAAEESSESSVQNDPLKEALQRLGPAPFGGTLPAGTMEILEPPRKSRTRRGLFEGDAAAIELRTRLAQGRGGIPTTAARDPAPSRLGAAFRFIGFLMVVAALAGAVGYVVGVARPPAKSARLAAASTEADMPLAPLTPPAARNPADRNSEPQTAATDGAPAMSGGAPDDAVAPGDAAAVESAQQPEPPVSHSAPQPPVTRPDASGIAARMKIGSDLMAAGDVAAARTMFERVAEAGDAAGAFAVAETYDPSVLRTLHLRGGITPDPVLARRWYEKARDLGSSDAPERIARLRQNPQ